MTKHRHSGLFFLQKFQRTTDCENKFFQLSFNCICFHNCRREFFRSEGAAEFLPPTPSFRRTRADLGKRLRNCVSNFGENGFEPYCKDTPVLNFQEFCRLIQPREARQRTETLARRAECDSPSAGSKSLAILSICFAQLKINNINL